MSNDFWALTTGGEWTVSSNWSTNAVPGPGDAAVLGITGFAQVQNYNVSVATPVTAGSIAITNPGAVLSIAGPGVVTVGSSVDELGGDIEVQYDAAFSTGGNLTVASGAAINVDTQTNYGNDFSGGSTVAVGGTLSNAGALDVGGTFLFGGGITAVSTVSAAVLDNTGSISLLGNPSIGSTQQAQLLIADAAPTTWTGTVSLAGQSLLRFGSGEIQSIAQAAKIYLASPDGYIADTTDTNSNSALTGLTNNAGDFELQYGSTVALIGDLTNSGSVNVDTQTDYGDDFSGGSTLAIAGTLTNSGSLNLGGTFFFGGGITATSSVSAAALNNTGSISLLGNPDVGNTKQAQLLIASAAPTTWTGTISLTSQALLQYASGSINSIALGGEIYIASPDGYIADANDVTGNSALDGLTNNAGDFELQYGAAVSLSSDLINSGTIRVDTQTNYGDTPSGGSTLTIHGTLNNVGTQYTNNGSLAIGNGLLTGTTTVRTDAVDSTGSIILAGGSVNQAILDVTGAAGFGTVGMLTGTVILGNGGTSNSLIEFGSGQINAIASSADLDINSPTAFVADASDLASNSALSGLASNAGTFNIENGASVAPTGDFENSGTVDVDSTGYGEGGSDLSIAGTLTNASTVNTGNGQLNIGNGGLSSNAEVSTSALDNTGTIRLAGTATAKAILDVTGAAGFGTAGVLTGTVILGNNGNSNSLLEFGSGQIDVIASGAGLDINSPTAFVADASDLASNSALSGLASNAGTFNIENGASVAPTGDFENSGTVDVDSTGYGEGGSDLSIAGTLTNASTVNTGNGQLNIGNGGLSSNAEVSTSALDNTGTIRLAGTATAKAILDVTGAAGFGTAGVLTGTVILGNNGNSNSLLEFGSGQIDVIASGAGLDINSPTAFVADASDLASNSALSGLASNAGTFNIENGASVAPTGDFENSGTVDVDSTGYGEGGSDLSIAGTLTNASTVNTGNGQLNIGNGGLSSNAEVSTSALDNTGTIRLAGTATAKAILDVTGAAGFGTAGVLTGTVILGNNGTTNSLLEFGSGQITSIASGAYINLNSASSFVADASDVSSNSALTGLTSIAGALDLEHGTVVAIAGDLTNTGTLDLDNFDFDGFEVSGGSTLGIAGTLTNDAALNIGSTGLDAATFFSASSLQNLTDGTVNLAGSSSYSATFDLAGSLTNAGTMNVSSGTISEMASIDDSGSLSIGGSVGVATTFNDLGGADVSGTMSIGTYADVSVAGAVSDTGTLKVGGSLDIAASIDVSGHGSLQLSGGAIINANGRIVVESGATLSGYGTIDVAATIAGAATASGGLLDFAGPINGAGQFAIATGSELEFGGVVDGSSVSFGGNVGTLKLDAPLGFSDAITGLVAGDAIDLGGIIATSATVTGSTLKVTAGAQTLTYQVSGSGIAGNTFALEDDQQGGTNLVLGQPGPTISGPTKQTAFLGFPSVLGPLAIADPAAGNGPLTVKLTTNDGALSGTASNDGSLIGSGSSQLSLSGSLEDINTMLAGVLYSGGSAGATDHIQITVTDAQNATAAQTIALTTDVVPFTPAVINSPTQTTIIVGVPTALGGVSVSDPYAQSTGEQIGYIAVVTGDPVDGVNVTQLSASGGSGGVVTYQNGPFLEIDGTVQQINSYFADVGEAFALDAEDEAQINELMKDAGVFRNEEARVIIKDIYDTIESPYSPIKNQTIKALISKLQAFKTPLTSDAANYLSPLRFIKNTPFGPPPEFPPPMGGPLGVHVVTFDQGIYQLDATGEFVVAQSTQDGDSFQIQARLQPYQGSASVSSISELAAAVGNDRVTFAVGRAATLWVNGQATNIGPANPIMLAGGKISQAGVNTFVVSWNTGEILTVVDNGTELDLTVNPGTIEPGDVDGLMGAFDGAAYQFTLPDGSALVQPLTTAELAYFANAWRVTDASTLFDYAPGQSTASFTDASFPNASITLADLPSSVVALATQAVLAAGITDAGVAAAVEFDYIATGGDPTTIANDKSLYQNATTSPVTVNETAAPPVVLGVIAPVSSILESLTGPTAVTFDVYLTAPEAEDTEIDYEVEASDATDFDAASFGGTLPSGVIAIAAGQTTGKITIDVPKNALGELPGANLAIRISSPNNVSVFAPTSVEAVDAAQVVGPSGSGSGSAAGLAAAVAALDYLGTLGNFSQVGNTYTLDLGNLEYGRDLPTLQFGIVNGADAPGDELTGNVTWPTVAGFQVSFAGSTVSGASLASPIAAGQSYNGLTITTDQNKFGAQSETVTFNPVDINGSGYSASQTPITLTITDTLEVPGMIYSQATGDVHIITYNGLHYDFQAAGEFTLAQSHVAGDSFDIQLRLQPYTTTSSVTFITQVAVSIGDDRVTFGQPAPDRAAEVLVDGNPTSLSLTDGTLTLAGGTITEISPTVYKLAWNTGESATISEGYSPILGINYFNVSDALPYASYGEVSGLQGENEGPQNDLQLPDGTVLSQPITESTLYGEYANAWRVTPASSLFDYGPGESTATYTDVNFPLNTVSLADLPTSVVAQAAKLVAAAGITDPVEAADAELDYIVTGDPGTIATAANVAQQVIGTVDAAVTQDLPSLPAIGVEANTAEEVEAATGVTAVTFTAYLTAAATSDTTVDYAVVDDTPGDLGPIAYGGSLPSGAVTIKAGATTATFTIDVAPNGLGAVPNADLAVKVSSPGDALSIFAPTASTEIVNTLPIAGAPALPVFGYLGTDGTFTFDAATSTYTLNLGNITQGSFIDPAEFAVSNAARAPGDALAGTFSFPNGTGFTIVGNNILAPLAAGGVYEGLYASVDTADLGDHSLSLTYTPTDVNESGYTKSLAPLVLDIVDTVIQPAIPQVNTPSTIIFADVHVGGIDSQHVSVTNTAAMGAQTLDVTLMASGDAVVGGAVSNLAPRTTDASDLTVGFNTGTAGALSGSITEVFASGGAGPASPIAEESPYIDIFGSVYRLADPSVQPGNLTAHVGDTSAQTITLTNLDANDGYSENLIATVVGTTGAVVASGTTGPIAAQSSGTISVAFSTKTAGSIGTVTLDLESSGTGIDSLGVTDLGDVTIPIMVTGTNVPAIAQLEETSGGGTLTQNGAAYALDLGSVAQGSPSLVAALAALNAASAPADLLSGTATANGDPAFTNALSSVSDVAAAATGALGSVTFATDTPGSFTDTITFDSASANADGSTALAPETLTITGTVTPAAVTPAPAVALIAPASPIALGSVRVGGTLSKALSVTNSVTGPADNLDVSAGMTTGDAGASGTITGLAAGQTNTTALAVDLGTSMAGAQTGTATFNLTSDPGGDTATTSLPTQTVTLTGNVYREATAALGTPSTPLIVHVRDSIAAPLAITNSAAADGFSENLIATGAGAGTGGVTATGTSGDIAAGATNSAVTIGFSTLVAGTISGMATINFASDGIGLDGSGPTSIGSQSVAVEATVDNYATAALSETSGGGTLTQNGNAYKLDLGDVAQGATAITVGLAALNTAIGTADLLAGTFNATGSSAFTNALTSVAGIGASGEAEAGSVTLATGTAGTFTDVITFDATGSNASGYSGALAPETLTVTGTVVGAEGQGPGGTSSPIPPASTVLPASPIASTSQSANGSRDDIYALYLTVLGRAPDLDGYDYWTGQLQTGTPLAKISHSLFASAEYAADYGRISHGSNKEFINQLYENGLHREAEPAGLRKYESYLTAGTSHAKVALDIASSKESRIDIAATPQAQTFVSDATLGTIGRLYGGLLDRAPDPEGLASADTFAQSGGSLRSIAKGMIASPEYAALHGSQGNAQFVEALFEGAFGRSEGSGGAEGYLHALNTGASRASVALNIVESAEAIAHLNPRIASVANLA